MITYKPIIIQGGRRQDGTWPVKIRVTFKGKSRRLPTTLVCYDQDLTRSGHIKNATILQRAGELIARMRSTTETLSPFTLDGWGVDEVVRHIRDTLAVQDFHLDFFQFADEWLEGRTIGTQKVYRSALAGLERYLGKRELDINTITRRMLLSLADYLDSEPWQHYDRNTGKTRATTLPKTTAAAKTIKTLEGIFNAAKYRYNDEDEGRILIPRSPFHGLQIDRPQYEGARPLTIDEMQALIDYRPTKTQAKARAVFLLSFATMGANMADLYAARPTRGRVWVYNRAKTAGRRADKAEVKVALTDEALALAELLHDGTEWWLGVLHRQADRFQATATANRGLQSIAKSAGIDGHRLTMYSARKTWATLGRSLGIEKATIDEGLGHRGNYTLADIYAARNWDLAAIAHRQIMDLLDWSAVLTFTP